MKHDLPGLEDFQLVGADLYRFGLVTSHGGNLSVRLGDGLLITGSGKRLGYLSGTDLSVVSNTGEHEAGPLPSSDLEIHLAVYSATNALAVVHAHAPHAVAITAEGATFAPEDFEGSYHLTDVPVVDQGPDVARRIASALAQRRVAILRDHGVYARGGDLWQALHWVMTLEESARIAWLRRAVVRIDRA